MEASELGDTQWAPEIEEIACRLIDHADGLKETPQPRIAYLFSPRIKVRARGLEVMAMAERFPPRHQPLARYDFVIIVSKPVWNELDEAKQEALVYHELLHCGRNPKGKWRIVPHDFEEFELVVKRYGLWLPEVRKMADTMTRVAQLETRGAHPTRVRGDETGARRPEIVGPGARRVRSSR